MQNNDFSFQTKFDYSSKQEQILGKYSKYMCWKIFFTWKVV